MDIVGIILLGFVAGWLASRLMETGIYRLLGDIAVGIAGAYAGTWVASQLLGSDTTRLDPASVAMGLVGALAMIVLFSMLGPGRQTLGQILLGR
ncbi:MAG: GlsB/YeaQ/YmgE family stress response membrane protein [Chloroflexota bacterium]